MMWVVVLFFVVFSLLVFSFLVNFLLVFDGGGELGVGNGVENEGKFKMLWCW